VTPLELSLDAIDCFVDALWIEDGLSANTLAAYRRDLTLYAQWLAATHQRSLDDSREADLPAPGGARQPLPGATRPNRPPPF